VLPQTAIIIVADQKLLISVPDPDLDPTSRVITDPGPDPDLTFEVVLDPDPILRKILARISFFGSKFTKLSSLLVKI